MDDPLRLGAYERLAASASVSELSDADRRLVTGFHFAVFPSKIAPKTLAESVALLHAHPAIVEELRELLPLLDERSEHLTYPLDLAQPAGSPVRVPLSVHARHTVDDVLTAFGILDFNKTAWKQTGTDPRRADELGPVLCDARKVGTRVFAVHALQGLCDFAHAVPLGVAVDHHAAVENGTALHSSPEPWRQHLAVRASKKEAGRAHDAIHVLRRRRLRLAQGRPANQLCVEIAETDARGFLPAGEGGQRLTVSATSAARAKPSIFGDLPVAEATH